jgi:hypothetical protein
LPESAFPGKLKGPIWNLSVIRFMNESNANEYFDVWQGCQMVYFQTKNSKLGKICRALEWKMLIHIFNDHLEYYSVIWDNLWSFGIVWGHLDLYFPVLVCLD